jgi:hypothetical protein
VILAVVIIYSVINIIPAFVIPSPIRKWWYKKEDNLIESFIKKYDLEDMGLEETADLLEGRKSMLWGARWVPVYIQSFLFVFSGFIILLGGYPLIDLVVRFVVEDEDLSGENEYPRATTVIEASFFLVCFLVEKMILLFKQREPTREGINQI